MRAIAEAAEHPVDLQICGEFASMLDLLLAQPYLAGVIPDPRWSMSDGWEAPRLPQEYARVIHLGYRRWPELALPFEAARGAAFDGMAGAVPDLHRPWITGPWEQFPHRVIAIGWTDCHFELKVGLSLLLSHNWNAYDPLTGFMLAAPGSRWVSEMDYDPVGWVEAAGRIAASQVFLGDCSALHVLACALGKPVVCYEPMEARHNDIFFPLGKTGPQVTLVIGNDGLPTCDSRHTAETLERVLARVR